MSDRAEQAKALTADELREAAQWITAVATRNLVLNAADALTASEAEVTRLETGIAEARTIHANDSYKRASLQNSMNCADAVQRHLASLSQPTTDTNGAHA